MTQPAPLLSSIFPAIVRRPEILDFEPSRGEIITTHPRLEFPEQAEVPEGNPLHSIFSNPRLASFFYLWIRQAL